MINGIIKWSLNNRLLVLALAFILLVGGLISAVNTPVDVLPEFVPTQVIVQTNAPGLASEEVESLITIPLESALRGTNKVETVRSSSLEGLSFITVVFEWGTNVYNARQLVSEKIQTVAASFPPLVKPPFILPITSPIGSVYYFALTSKVSSLMELRTFADWEIKNKLLAIPGVAKVSSYGGEVKQYQILINPNKLRQYGITLDKVVQAAEKANVIVSGGYLVENDREYLIRGIGKIQTIDDLALAVVDEKNNVPVYLKDIATVKIGHAFKRSGGSVDGKEAVIVTVSKQPGVNTLKLNEKIKEVLNDLKKTLPHDIKITQTYNQSDFVDTSIKNILSSMLQGGFLVIIVLFSFLANWRTGFISVIAMPLSILTALLVLKFQGMSINAMTLGGLAVAVGEIVDDAIIDIENIYKRLRQNKLSTNPKPVLDVIFQAASEVRNSVVYGTFIIVVVLSPVLFLSGLAGQIFKPLVIAYITAIFASLFIALTLTPALSFYLLSRNETLPSGEPPLITKIKEKYLKVLKVVLQRPGKLFVLVIVFSFSAFLLSLFLGKSFLPELGEENLVVMTYTPPGSSLSVTQRLALNMEKILHKYPGIIRVSNRAGRSEAEYEPISANISHFDIALKNGLAAGSKKKLIENIKEEFEKIPATVVLVRSFITETIEHLITGQRAPIVLKLYGNNLEVLRDKAKEVAHVLRDIDTLEEIQIEPIVDIPQIHIKIKRTEAARYGLTVGDLLHIIQVSCSGVATSQKVLEGQRAFDIFVWLEEPYRKNLDVIKNMLIDTPSGIKIPLGQLADIKESSGPNIINREKTSRRIAIQANAEKKDISKAVEKAQKLINKNISLPEGYTIDFEGEYKQQKEANKKLLLLSILVLSGIYLLLSIAFKSIKISAVIMSNLPFAMLGGVVAIAVTEQVLSVASIIGFITLFGVSTRNTILLVNRFFDIQKNNPSLSIDEVVTQGALDRLPPILMTALTASFAMLPLALFSGAGREIEHPLAIVIFGGMFSATTLTLLVIPAVYKQFVRQKQKD